MALPPVALPPNSFEGSAAAAAAAARLRRDELLLSMPEKPIVPSIDLRWAGAEAGSCIEAEESLRGVEAAESPGVEGTGGRGPDEGVPDASLFMDCEDDRRKKGIELGVRRLLELAGVWAAEESPDEGSASELLLGSRRAV